MREHPRRLEAEGRATEGGCKPIGAAPADGVMIGGLAPGQRWSCSPQTGSGAAAVARRVSGRSVAGAGVEIYQLEKWRDKGLSGIDAALKEREGDSVQAELGAAIRRIGEPC